MGVRKISVAPTIRAKVAIVGAGIAGAWLGLKLARAGVDTLLIHYSRTDRGGAPGSTARSVGAINTAPIDRKDFRAFLDEIGQGQNHPSVVDMLLEHLDEELDELKSLTALKSIKLGVALADGDTEGFLHQLYALYESYGGRMLDAWVTRLEADEYECRGLQYQQGDSIGKVLAPSLVIASGGYTGLFDGSVKTNNYGTMLGRFLQAGGVATNLEFIFKHGYGKPDLGALTPTEELPGAEIYDSAGLHVDWLERELFEGRGTENHLEAFKYWRRNKEKDFFIDLRFEGLYRKVKAFNAALDVGKQTARAQQTAQEIVDMSPSRWRTDVERQIRGWLSTGEKIDFDRFGDLKPYFSEVSRGEVFRVRQIAYFSMGGIAHMRCATNLKNVFVSGEAMHDFGAHRVGGLPWGLYLVSGRSIKDQILTLMKIGELAPMGDFELVHETSSFDGDMLNVIREGLHRYQEQDFNAEDADLFVNKVRSLRRDLLERGCALSDAVAWLVVAEAIMKASLCRTESRGCFYRADYPQALENMKVYFSGAAYDMDSDMVNAQLLRVSELADYLGGEHFNEERCVEVG